MNCKKMKKMIDRIGVRLYALRYIPEYRTSCLISVGLFVTSLLLIFDIFSTEVF